MLPPATRLERLVSDMVLQRLAGCKAFVPIVLENWDAMGVVINGT